MSFSIPPSTYHQHNSAGHVKNNPTDDRALLTTYLGRYMGLHFDTSRRPLITWRALGKRRTVANLPISSGRSDRTSTQTHVRTKTAFEKSPAFLSPSFSTTRPITLG